MLSKRTLLGAMLIASTLTAAAQSSINSPYTRFGLGELSARSLTHNAAMGGIGYGLRNNTQINLANPASVSSVDSLSFMFDIGMSLKSSNFSENGIKNNARNSSFDNLAMQFRLHPRLGIAIAFTPFSSVGYNFTTTTDNASNTFYADGGFRQITAALGFKVFKNLSIGVESGFLKGSIDYSTTILPNGTNSDYTIKYRTIDAKSYVANFGVQYNQRLSKKDALTLGITYGLGHKLSSTYTAGTTRTDNSTDTETTETKQTDCFELPHTIGAGLTFTHNRSWTVGADYTIQKWGSVKNNALDNSYKNLEKIAVGAEYRPNALGRSYLKRIFYRVGAYYNNSYYTTKEGNGPKEYGVSAGLGLPLFLYQRSTYLNITGQYVRVQPSKSDLLSENRFVIKLGLTFNEHWFMKWKVN